MQELEIIFANIDKIPDEYYKSHNFRFTMWLYQVNVIRWKREGDDFFHDDGVLGSQPFLPCSVRQRFGITKRGKVIFECVVSPHRNSTGRFMDKTSWDVGDYIEMSFQKFRAENPQVEFFFPSMEDWTGFCGSIRDVYRMTNPEAKLDEVLHINNAELRRGALKRFPIKEILKHEYCSLLDESDEGILFRIWSSHFIWVKDASTPREYILAVPQTWRKDDVVNNDIPITTVHIARAWTFGIHPSVFHPDVET